MRTTYKDVENVAKILSEETCVPYAVDGYAPGLYNVSEILPGNCRNSPIISGTASECYYAIQAIRNHMKSQSKKPSFIVTIADGILQTVTKIGEGELHYLLIDEDELGIMAEEETDFSHLTRTDIIKQAIIVGMDIDEFLRVSNGAIPDTKPETIIRALYDQNYTPEGV